MKAPNGAFFLSTRGLMEEGADGPLFCFRGRLTKVLTTMRDALMRLLEPPVEASGYELVDIEFARQGRGGVLRVYIDRPPHSGAAAGRCREQPRGGRGAERRHGRGLRACESRGEPGARRRGSDQGQLHPRGFVTGRRSNPAQARAFRAFLGRADFCRAEAAHRRAKALRRVVEVD